MLGIGYWREIRGMGQAAWCSRIGLLVLVIFAGNTYGQETPPTEKSSPSATPEPESTPASEPKEALDGAALVKENCMQCHRSDNPKYPDHNVGWVYGKRYSLEGWKDNIDRMEKIGLKDEYISEPWSAEVKEAMAKHLVEETKVALTDEERVGMFHYSVVHFPIALIFVVLALEGLGLILRWPAKHDLIHLLLLLGVISAAAASGLGLLLAKEMMTMSEDLSDHRIAGLATLGLAAGAFLLREVTVLSGMSWSRWGYRLLLLLAAISVGAAGHLGGMLVHGEFLPFLVAG